MDITLPIIAILPAIQTLGSTHCLSTPMFTLWIILLLVALCVSSIKTEIKTAFATLILTLYWRNIDLLVGFSTELFYPSNVRRLSVETAKCLLEKHFVIQCKVKVNQPTIFICNYARDRFENGFILYLPVPFVLLASSHFTGATNIEALIPSISIPLGNSFGFLEKEIPKQMSKGQSILCYSQKPLYFEGRNYGKFRSGIFSIVKSLGLTITPLYIQPIQTHVHSISHQTINIVAGPPTKVYKVADSIVYVKKFFTRMDSIFTENK